MLTVFFISMNLPTMYLLHDMLNYLLTYYLALLVNLFAMTDLCIWPKAQLAPITKQLQT